MRDVPLAGAEAVTAHKAIIERNAILRWCYDHRYQKLLAGVRNTQGLTGALVEIGCGAGHLERWIPGLIKTDIVPHSNVDIVVNAEERLPFEDESVRALFLVSVLHHMHEPVRFLAEAERCLVRGGRLMLQEGSASWMARIVGNLCLPYEFHDADAQGWTNRVENRLEGANVALPWIILERDRAEFERRFPRLKIRETTMNGFLAYYLSGGLHYRPFVPALALPVVGLIEWLAHPFRELLYTEMIWEIEKT